jgi:hypothetical protein
MAASGRRRCPCNGVFLVREDVSAPEHMAEARDRPAIGIVKFDAPAIDLDAFITTLDGSRPRVAQNHVFLLLPEIVETTIEPFGDLEKP